jgi:16S rRNA processing protein RimM
LSSPKKILLGRIGAAHGIKGSVKLTSFTAVPMNIGSYGPLSTNRADLTITITALKQVGTALVARLKGVSDRDTAETLNGTELYADRSVLPPPDDEDDFYHSDLIGLEARLTDGHILGEVSALPNFGAGDVIEVRDPRTGETFLYPFTKLVVPQISITEGYLVIDPPLDADPGEEEPD